MAATYYKICNHEHECPWRVKPRTGMYDPKLGIYATDCILYTICPRAKWSSKRWKKHNKTKGEKNGNNNE